MCFVDLEMSCGIFYELWWARFEIKFNLSQPLLQLTDSLFIITKYISIVSETDKHKSASKQSQIPNYKHPVILPIKDKNIFRIIPTIYIHFTIHIKEI